VLKGGPQKPTRAKENIRKSSRAEPRQRAVHPDQGCCIFVTLKVRGQPNGGRAVLRVLCGKAAADEKTGAPHLPDDVGEAAACLGDCPRIQTVERTAASRGGGSRSKYSPGWRTEIKKSRAPQLGRADHALSSCVLWRCKNGQKRRRTVPSKSQSRITRRNTPFITTQRSQRTEPDARGERKGSSCGHRKEPKNLLTGRGGGGGPHF